MKKVSATLVIFILTVAASWSLFRPAFFRIHDYVHAARIAEMSRALEDGQFPVRWSEHFGYGYGMPLFEFYAPLPYYVGALGYWLGIEVVAIIKLLFILASLGTALGAFALGKKLFGNTGAILTATALTLAPYRAVNLFVRGALSEAWGMMAMPWILLGVVKVAHREKDGWLMLTLSLVVLMLSHNIMTMLFVPFVLLFGALYVGYRKWIVQRSDYSQLQVFHHLITAFLVAGGLAAFYLIPALVEKDFTQVSQIFGGYFHYSQHFLYLRQFLQVNWGYTGSVWGPEDGISFFLGWGQWLGLGSALFLLTVRLIQLMRKHGLKKLGKILTDNKLIAGLIFGLLFVAGLFMTLFRSKVLWDALPALAYAQFPWRFMGVGVLFLSLLIGFSVTLIKNKRLRYLVTIGLFLIMLQNSTFFKPAEYLANNDDYYYTDADRIEREMSSILPDYIPSQMSTELTAPTVQAWCEPDCAESVELLVKKSDQMLVKTNFAQDQTLQLAIADYPGWRIELDGQTVSKFSTEMGNLAISVPAGEHLVGARLTSTPIRLIADLISLSSWLLLIYLSFFRPPALDKIKNK